MEKFVVTKNNISIISFLNDNGYICPTHLFRNKDKDGRYIMVVNRYYFLFNDLEQIKNAFYDDAIFICDNIEEFFKSLRGL